MQSSLNLAWLGSLSPAQWTAALATLLALLWVLGCRMRVNKAQRAVDQAWQHWLTQQVHKLHMLEGLSGPTDAQPGCALWLRVQAASKQYALLLNTIAAAPTRCRSWRHQPGAASQVALLHEQLFRNAMQGWLDSATPSTASNVTLPPPQAGNPAEKSPQDAADQEASAVERLLQCSHPMLHTVLHLESDARQRYNSAAVHYNLQRCIGPTRALAALMPWPAAQTLPEGLLRVELTPPVSADLS